VPKRFGLVYRDKTNGQDAAVHPSPRSARMNVHRLSHRALRRQLPALVAPDQVRVLTLNDDAALLDYAKPIVNELRANFVRVSADFSTDPSSEDCRSREGKSPHHAGHRRPRRGSGSGFCPLARKGNVGAKPKGEVVADILAAIKDGGRKRPERGACSRVPPNHVKRCFAL